MIRFVRHAVLGALIATLVSPAVAESGGTKGDLFKQYYFLRAADFNSITGCGTSFDYRHAMETAMRFLGFRDPNENIHYARRHTLPFFRALRHNHATAEGYVEARCLPASLRQIGFALRLPDAEGRFGKNGIPPSNYAYKPALLKKLGPFNPAAFPVMSRINYIERTGCKVSPTSYKKYRVAFEWVVLKRYWLGGPDDKARKSMVGFLEDLFSSRPTSERFVSRLCMIPAISRVAADLGLLDGKGRYRAKR